MLWYYRPEHVTGGSATAANKPVITNEIYASAHCDTNPVDCIEDKAYVLTFSAFARFMAFWKHRQVSQQICHTDNFLNGELSHQQASSVNLYF